ncbi:amidase family protein [Patescibacteria group bacterium]
MKNDLNYIISEVDKSGSVTHKDNYLIKGTKTTAASKVLENYQAQYTSTVVDLIEKEGYRTKAKVNLDAWAHGASGENSDFGPTKNPWNPKKTPGGSCSGSGASVADGYAEYSFGTDTGGSIRLPACFTNTVGLKPTYGSLSRYGIIAMGSSLDCPSIISTSVEKVKKIYEACSKEDSKDSNTQLKTREKEKEFNFRESQKITIGIPDEYFLEGLDKEVKEVVTKAIDTLKNQGHELVNISLPHTKYGIAVYYLVMSTEVSSNLSRYDGVRYGKNRGSFGQEAERRILLGTFASSSGYSSKYYEKAAKVRTLIKDDFTKAFKKVDVIMGPVSPTPPFDLGERVNDPLKMYLSDVLTVNASLAGIPSLALPCGFTKSDLPIGMQIIGPRWSEEVLFGLGSQYQKTTDWHTRRPKS